MLKFRPIPGNYELVRSWDIGFELYAAEVKDLGQLSPIYEYYKYDIYDENGKWMQCFWSIDNNLFQS